jgi:myo-inositol-1(or 4)-monophosphatase
MKLEWTIRQAINLVKSIGLYIKTESHKFSSSDIEEKGFHDLVSYVDKEAERRLVEELGKIIPGSGFIAEENPTLSRSENFNWIIDPLDGTTNFLHGIPVFSVSVALMYKEQLVAGIVYEINRDECFYAWKDSPAYLNDQKISVSSTTSFEKALVATGFPYHDYSRLPSYLDLFSELMKTTRGIRRLGSAAVDLAYIACGRFDIFFEYSLNPWDVAAGAFIVQQAGGTVSDFQNKNNFLFGREIIATNSHMHQQFCDKLASYFYPPN